MKLRNNLVVMVGLMAFAIDILGIVWAKFSHTYWQLFLMGIPGVVFALLSIEFFHSGLSPQVKKYRFFSRGFRGLFFDFLHLSMAIFLTLATASYQRPSDPLCGGGLSGGFPLAFLCDNAGESPIRDWGIITWGIDMPNLLGTYIDVLFYLAVLWAISFMALMTIQPLKKRMKLGQ